MHLGSSLLGIGLLAVALGGGPEIRAEASDGSWLHAVQQDIEAMEYYVTWQAPTPFQTHGRWLTVPWGGWQEWMLSSGQAAGRSGGLLLKKTDNQLVLFWDASCVATDIDYELYAGDLGAFPAHVPLLCSTLGATTTTFAPGPGSAYYLVVPRTQARKGSYGTDHTGVERPVSTNACLAQQIDECRP